MIRFSIGTRRYNPHDPTNPPSPIDPTKPPVDIPPTYKQPQIISQFHAPDYYSQKESIKDKVINSLEITRPSYYNYPIDYKNQIYNRFNFDDNPDIYAFNFKNGYSKLGL